MPAPSPAFVASKAQLGYGSAFYIGTGSPVTYSQISELATISFPGFEVPAIDVTNLGSPDTTEEMIPGMKKPGVMEMTGNFIGDNSQMTIDEIMSARTIFPFMVTAPVSNGKTVTATGFGFFTKNEKGPMEPNKKIDFKVSVQVTGAVVWTVA
jgi:hypothetical protein